MPSDSRTTAPERPTIPIALHVVGALALVVSAIAALSLVGESLGAISLPGCGEGSPCAQAAAGRWGRVPGVNWPTSFVGLAFYLGMLAAWLTARSGATTALRNFARLGGLGAGVLIVVMLVERHACPYCLAAHAAYGVFWLVCELSRKATIPSLRPAAVLVGVFALVTAVLAPVQWQTHAAAQAKAERELAESTEQIVAATTKRPQATSMPADTAHPPAADEPAPANATNAPSEFDVVETPTTAPTLTTIPAQVAGDGSTTTDRGFTGRYHLGPDVAPIRIVVFSDYQCADCRKIETQLRHILDRRDAVYYTPKQFPMGMDCNPLLKSEVHPNSCWAARAAEAAGLLYGNDGFFKMHQWLFDHGGAFTDAELKAALDELGFNRDEFLRVMQSEETLELVQADIAEGVALGIQFTPMIFINGVEFRGWNANEALIRTVRTLGKSDLPPGSPLDDHPPSAAEKYIADWALQPKLPMTDEHDWPRGPETGAIEAVLFGDYREANTGELDALLKEIAAEGTPIRYHYRPYPFDQDCNPDLPATRYPLGCMAARAAQAAGNLGGSDGFWRMHDWLLANREDFSETTLRAAAPSLGFDSDALLTEMDSEDVAAAIAEDVSVAKKVGVRAIPTVFIDGKRVPRWKRGDQEVIREIIAKSLASE